MHAVTGRPLSTLQGAREASGELGASCVIALAPRDRAMLHAAIAHRFEAMLAAGLIDEVRGLRARYGLDAAMPSMRSVGYRQAWEHLEGRFDARTLRERGIAATRQLAKRQLTWMRAMDVEPIDCFGPDLQHIAASRAEAALAAVAPR